MGDLDLSPTRKAELTDAWSFCDLDDGTFLGFGVYAPEGFRAGDTVRTVDGLRGEVRGIAWALPVGETATVVEVDWSGTRQGVRLRNQAGQVSDELLEASDFVAATHRPPELELVLDYLSLETFLQGTSYDYSHASGNDQKTRLPSMTSTTRGRINGWLPLYINEKHWAHARGIDFARNLFASLATGRQSAEFRSEHALDVCCRLLLSAVKGFTVGQRADRAARNHVCDLKASDRAVQMYADIHRLFLQIANDIPEVRNLAQTRLRAFIKDPGHRRRRSTPDLGHLIQYLLIAEEITWQDLAPTFVPEALRRHVARGVRARRFSDQPKEPFASQTCRSVAEIIGAFDKFAPAACQVTYFCVLFYKDVGRPHGQSLSDVEAAYDRKWGGLAQQRKDEIVARCAKLCESKSVRDIIPPMVEGSSTDDDLAELLLWAEHYGWGHPNDVIPVEQWPQKGKHVMLQAWRQGTDTKTKGKGKRRSYDAQSAASHGDKGTGKSRDQASHGAADAQGKGKGKGKGKGADHPIGDPAQNANGNYKGKGKGKGWQTGHSSANAAVDMQQAAQQQQQQVVMMSAQWYPAQWYPAQWYQQPGTIAYNPRQSQTSWQNWQWYS